MFSEDLYINKSRYITYQFIYNSSENTDHMFSGDISINPLLWGCVGIILILRPTFYLYYVEIQPGKYLPGRFLHKYV